jgi:hypothetical protein
VEGEPVEAQEFRLGCLTRKVTRLKPTTPFVKQVPQYAWRPVRVARPSEGIRRETIACPGCGKEVRVSVPSQPPRLAMRLKALLLGRSPGTPQRSLAFIGSLLGLVFVFVFVFIFVGDLSVVANLSDQDWKLVSIALSAVAFGTVYFLFDELNPAGRLPSIVGGGDAHKLEYASWGYRSAPGVLLNVVIIAIFGAFIFALFERRSTEPSVGTRATESNKTPKGPGLPPPSPYVAPRFTIDAVNPLSGGGVGVTATFPKPGTVAAGDKDDPALGTAFPGTPQLQLTHVTVKRRGTLSFVLDPTGAARSRLRDGSLKMKIMLAYIPHGQTLSQHRTAGEVTLVGR